MGTISDIVGAIFLIVAGLIAWNKLRPSRRNRDKIDGSMYDDVE